MSTLEMKRATARAKARETLAAMPEAEDRTNIDAALADPDAHPLDEARLNQMRPASAGDAMDLQRRVRGRPRSDAPKRLVSLRLDPDVIDHFRAAGPGWQSRINDALRRHLIERLK